MEAANGDVGPEAPLPQPSVYTITFGDRAEHDFRSEKIGKEAAQGLSTDVLRAIRAHLSAGEYMELTPALAEVAADVDLRAHDAGLLVLRDGVNTIMNDASFADRMHTEQMGLEYTKHGVMYKKLRNKVARWTSIFTPEAKAPTFRVGADGKASGQGAQIAFASVPKLDALRGRLQEILAAVGMGKGMLPGGLMAEGNHYYRPERCGIGFHGDGERMVTIGARLGPGVPFPIVFQWHRGTLAVGGFAAGVVLQHGDVYFMSAKATGSDWKRSKIHLRHAAGAAAYLMPKSLDARRVAARNAGASPPKEYQHKLEEIRALLQARPSHAREHEATATLGAEAAGVRKRGRSDNPDDCDDAEGAPAAKKTASQRVRGCLRLSS